jgi:predicted DNA-binding transcriptional regulator AlpA
MSMKIPLNIEKDLQNRFEKLPSNMTAKDIAKFLGVSNSTAYNIAHAPDFPRLKTPGRRLVIIPKIGFIEWYLANCVTAADI